MILSGQQTQNCQEKVIAIRVIVGGNGQMKKFQVLSVMWILLVYFMR